MYVCILMYVCMFVCLYVMHLKLRGTDCSLSKAQLNRSKSMGQAVGQNLFEVRRGCLGDTSVGVSGVPRGVPWEYLGGDPINGAFWG